MVGREILTIYESSETRNDARQIVHINRENCFLGSSELTGLYLIKGEFTI